MNCVPLDYDSICHPSSGCKTRPSNFYQAKCSETNLAEMPSHIRHMHMGSPTNYTSQLEKPADDKTVSGPNRREHVEQNAMTYGDILEMSSVERAAFHPKPPI